MDKQEYLELKVKPLMEKIIFQLVCERPEEPATFMVNWIQKNEGCNPNVLTPKEKKELEILRKEILKYRPNYATERTKKNLNNFFEDSEEEEIYNPKKEKKKQKMNLEGRKGISAESYGKFNVKEKFVPPYIPKSEEQTAQIKLRMMQSFLFNNLEITDMNIVIGAMDGKIFEEGQTVIEQGENGDCLYIVESGELDCVKKFSDSEKPKFLKTYVTGEAFGELALLYNAPRAATIKSKTESILWVLDRDTFNNIVKDSARNRREKYEKFLKSVEILSTMDNYEISQVSEALKRCSFKSGELIIRQGDVGDIFYIIEEGEATAFGNKEAGKPQIPEMNYIKGSYFGELALLRDQPRAANVRAKSDVKLLSLDRSSFKRVLGPIDPILKRNADKYKKFFDK